MEKNQVELKHEQADVEKNQPEILEMKHLNFKNKRNPISRINSWIISELESDTENFTWNETQRHKKKKIVAKIQRIDWKTTASL